MIGPDTRASVPRRAGTNGPAAGISAAPAVLAVVTVPSAAVVATTVVAESAVRMKRGLARVGRTR
jgi:hypothetical protein